MAAGTISIKNGEKVITGIDTNFTDALNPGDFIVFTAGNVVYTLAISSIESDTSATLTKAYAGPTVTGAGWSAVPSGTMAAITMEVVTQVTEALRGLNFDKSNWQQVFSSDEEITVTLPDGKTFSGPSWGMLIEMVNALNTNMAAPVVTGTLNQDALPNGTYGHTILSGSATTGAKHYLRKFRGAQPDTVFHETVEGSLYRLATGRTDEQSVLEINNNAYLRVPGEFQTTNPNGLRIAYGDYGTLIRSDGGITYFLLTNAGDPFGNWNALRPILFENTTGRVTLGEGVNVTGAGINTNLLNSTGTITARNAGPFAFAEQYNSVASSYFEEIINLDSTISEYHAMIKQRISAPNAAASISMGTLIQKGETENSTHLSWHLHMRGTEDNDVLHAWDIQGNYNAPGMIIPGNYENFDARYQRNLAAFAEHELTLTELREHRINCAIRAIQPLQAAVDLDMATDAEREQLNALKLYLVELHRLDLTKRHVKWPKAPDNS